MKESRYNVWVERPDAAYVYNGLSGSLLRLPKDGRHALERMLAGDGSSGCSAQLVRELAVGRMLVASDVDELDLLEARYSYSRHDTSTFALTIVTSLGCNFDCPYCFEAKHPSILNSEVEEALLAVVDEQLPRIVRFTVTWFGGEPLVGKRPLLALSDAFIERCDEADVAYDASIITNGYLLGEKTCRELRERRVTDVQVGLDGPPAVHNVMRPIAGGTGADTFWRIVENLHHAVEHFRVNVRVNLDTSNAHHAEELLQLLAAEGFVGKLGVYPGQIVGVGENPAAPSSGYASRCFRNAEFARVSLDFARLAARYGFGKPSLPGPIGTPCTAVRANELVVGSDGELYKCWDSVGNGREVIGHIASYRDTNGRLRKWLAYDPFSDDECRSCIALPVCMGGCAHHSLDLNLHENRCTTFRHNYQDQVLDFVVAEERGRTSDVAVPVRLASRSEGPAPATSTANAGL